MKATLLPLLGKYYGTEIEIYFEDDPNSHTETLTLWDTTGFIPSIRYLEKYGYTQEDWDSGRTDDDFICDSHFESKLTYERALKLVNLINSSKE